MKIIAHRGLWNSDIPKNSLKALVGAIENKYGIETDVRDFKGKVVVSHDMPIDNFLLLKSIEKKLMQSEMPVALNIKSDGLANNIKELISRGVLKDYFAFDMSLPQMVEYAKENINFFTHISDVMMVPPLIKESSCKGIWVDCFYSLWYDKEKIKELLKFDKILCFVSEELHGRENLIQWKILKDFKSECKQCNIYLCTDFPEKAKEYFND